LTLLSTFCVVARVTKAAWDVIREQEFGRIVNVASASGLGLANYSTRKLAGNCWSDVHALRRRCHGPTPGYGLTVLASCMSRVLAPEVQRRVPNNDECPA
jgi:NAD(P)-dependent dehydrogenase (short-subunit alcohol dehydrogenase family)